MDKIIQMLNNNLGNKITLELANGMLQTIKQVIEEKEQEATDGDDLV